VILELGRSARRRIIFSTPNFPYFRRGSETIVGFNPYEAHLSYVPRQFFLDRGYRIIPAGFPNPSLAVMRRLRRAGLVLKPNSPLSALATIFPVLAPFVANVQLHLCHNDLIF
jgi:hypothetical protein